MIEPMIGDLVLYKGKEYVHTGSDVHGRACIEEPTYGIETYCKSTQFVPLEELTPSENRIVVRSERKDVDNRLRHVNDLANQVNLTMTRIGNTGKTGLKHPDHEAVFEFDTLMSAEAFLVGYSAREHWGTGGPHKLKPDDTVS